MSRRPGTDQLVGDAQLVTQYVHGMDTISLSGMGEFNAIVSLDYQRPVAKVLNGPFSEIDGRVGRLFSIRIDEPLPGGFINDGILEEFLTILAGIAAGRNIFDVHLPFNARRSRGDIRFRLVTFPFLHRSISEAQPRKHSVERQRMSGIALVLSQPAVEFNDREVWVSPVVVGYPFDLCWSMRIGMRR